MRFPPHAQAVIDAVRACRALDRAALRDRQAAAAALAALDVALAAAAKPDPRGERVLVCGGRNFADRRLLFQMLNEQHFNQKIGFLIEGDAAGADRFAGEWAAEYKIPWAAVPANWRFQGKGAGAIRNQVMLDWLWPDRVIAFPGGRGTSGMIDLAEKAGVKVERISLD